VRVFVDRKEYCPGNTVNVTTELSNIGNVDIIGNLSTEIKNVRGVRKVFAGKLNIELPVSHSENVTDYCFYTIQVGDPGGNWTVLSNFTFDSNSSVNNISFLVKHPDLVVNLTEPKIELTVSPLGHNHSAFKVWIEDFCDDTTVTFDTSSGAPGDWVSFEPEEVLITQEEPMKEVLLNVSVPFTLEGDYHGKIFLQSIYDNVTLDLIVHVKGLAYQLNVTVPKSFKEVCLGDRVSAIVNVTKTRVGLIDANLTYQIRDANGSVLKEDKENITMNVSFETVASLISPDKEGTYYFVAIFQHNQTVLEANDTFKVVKCVPPERERKPSERLEAAPITPLYAMTLKLSTDVLSVVTGNKTSFLAYVSNIGSATLRNVKISIEGIPSSWISIFPPSSNIISGSTQQFLVVINVPLNAKTGVYTLKVQAVDEAKSNVEEITLIVAKNWKEAALLLLQELERLQREAERALSVKECMDVSTVETYHKDADFAFERGKKEYEEENYVEAISWFEYAIPLEKKVMNGIDVMIEVELTTTNQSSFIIPPFFEEEKYFQLASNYLEEKKYEEICEPIEKIRMFIIAGLTFWPGIFLIIILLIVVYLAYRRKKKLEEREKTLERLRERLLEEKAEYESVG